MRCPYLKSHSKKRCAEMEKAGRPAEISDFDFEHYCNGNPAYCYFYRKTEAEKAKTK